MPIDYAQLRARFLACGFEDDTTRETLGAPVHVIAMKRREVPGTHQVRLFFWIEPHRLGARVHVNGFFWGVYRSGQEIFDSVIAGAIKADIETAFQMVQWADPTKQPEHRQ